MNKKNRRTLRGKVISSKMNKTIVVLVERLVKHPLYQKYVRRRSKIHAHDEHNICKEGDFVVIAETRPIAKTKRWRLLKKIETL